MSRVGSNNEMMIGNMLGIGYDLLIYNPPGLEGPGLARKGSESGGLGVIDLEYLDVDSIKRSIKEMESIGLPFGVRVDPMSEKLQALITGELPGNMKLLIASPKETIPDMVRSTIYETAHSMGLKVFQEVCVDEEADSASEAGADGLVIRGNEGGGRIADMDLMEFISSVRKVNKEIPLIARGAVSKEMIGKLKEEGISGLVLDSQLLTLGTSDLPANIGELLTSFIEGSSFVIGSSIGRSFRFVATGQVRDELVGMEKTMVEDGEDPKTIYKVLKGAIGEKIQGALSGSDDVLFPAGEDLKLAREFEGYGGLSEAVSDMFGTPAPIQMEEAAVKEIKEEEMDMDRITVEGSAVPPDYHDRTIAVVGIGSVFPKGLGTDVFWEAIKNGVDASGEIPKDRWNWEYYFDSDRKAPDKTYTKIGAFITEMEMDFKEFRMPPKMFEQIDHYQRYAMRAAKEALIDAGLFENDSVDRTRVGVIVSNSGGGENRDWGSVRVSIDEIYTWMEEVDEWKELPSDARLRIREDLKKVMDTKIIQINEDSMPGCLPNIASGRLAHLFNFNGPNFITDAACASSLSAVHTARNALVLGQMDIAVSGGTDSVMTPQSFIEFCKIGALTEDGSRPFSEGANGFLMGEGAGIVILKRLDDAVRDGDKIYGLVRGVGASSDGKAKGITAPNPEGQRLALSTAYEDAGVAPSTISFIEAHGTSTAVGDVAELNSLNDFFKGLPAGSIGVTSIKSQIGHLKSAAGAAGMIKALLAITNKKLPPQINFRAPNPYFDWDSSPFYVINEMKDWERIASDVPRRCGVSAFGFGGTNFHMVLEEFDRSIYDAWKKAKGSRSPAIETTGTEADQAPKPEIDTKAIGEYLEKHGDLEAEAFLFSSDNPLDLLAQAEKAVEKAKEITLKGGRLRDAFEMPSYEGRYRLGISAKDPEHFSKQVEILKKVGMNEKGLMALAAKGIFVGDKERMDHGKVCLMFPGQGSQYINMFRELKDKFRIVQETFDEADNVMKDLIPEPLSSYVYKDVVPKTPEYKEASETLRQTEYNQPSMLTVDTSMYKLLKHLGIEPDLAMGHSLGEYGALIATGVMNFGDALKAVSARGREMRDLKVDDPGKMLSVMAGLDEVEAILDGIDGYVIPANKNCYVQTVVAGETEAVDEALKIFKEKGIEAVPIPVSHAFHSAVVAPVKEILRDYLSKLEIKPPKIPMLSNVTGGYYPSEGSDEQIKEKILDLLKEQVASSVEWIKQVKRAHEDGCRTFIEVGPKRALSSFAYNILEDEVKKGKVFPITSNHPKKGGLVTYNEMVSFLWSLGFDLNVPKKDDDGFYRSDFLNAFDGFVKQPAVPEQAPAKPIVEPKSPEPMITPTFETGGSSSFEEFLKDNKGSIERFLKEVYESSPKGASPEEPERMDVDLSGTGTTTPSRKGVKVVVSGAAFGLPGKSKKVFSEDNLNLLVQGRNLIEKVSDDMMEKFLEKNILRLDKKPDGSAEMIKLDDRSKVAHLSGMLGEFDLHREFGVPESLIESLDITSQLAIASGLLALKDAGIPLVRRYSQTSTGSFLPDEWELPLELQEDTGIIFASAFPGTDQLYTQLTRFYSNKMETAVLEERKRLHDLIIDKVKGTDLEEEIEKWAADNPDDASDYQIPRNYLFRVLAMGHSQLAQFIRAKGPNIQANSACATTTIAIGIAQDWIQAGRCKRVIVVGTDDPSSDANLEWFGSAMLAMGALTNEKDVTQAAIPFDERRKGMIIGAGAAALVVEAEEEPRRRGLEPLAEILGSHIGNSAFHGSRLDIAHIARSMERFIYKLEREHGFDRKKIASDMVFMSHETYTPARGGSSSAEVESLRRTFGDEFRDIIILNTKGYTGHAFASCIEDPVLVKCLEKGLAIPIANIDPEHIDKQFEGMQLSKGGTHNRHYGLRLAAGFGSQLSFLLLRKNDYDERYSDKERYTRWLRSIATTEPVDLEVEKNTLRLKDSGRDNLIPHRAVLRESSKIGYKRGSRIEVEEQVFNEFRDEVVKIFSDKMNFPEDTINIDDELESDMGIDTVKQVELFGAARIHFDLPKDEGVNLRDYPTLRDVINYIIEKRKMADRSKKAPDMEEAPVKAPEPKVKDFWELVQEKVIATVAEKTGYPEDMLELDLDLESDLGIDTVKQVELFAAAREEFDLPKDDNINLSDFNTLRKIIDYVVELKNESGPGAEAPQEIASIPEETPVEKGTGPQADWDMIKEKVIEIVADKTGYPEDMLELDLDLEADLGIDTVKQVELFAAAREDFDLPKDDNINLADFNTLRKIVDYVAGLYGGVVVKDDKKEEGPEEPEEDPEQEVEEKAEEEAFSKEAVEEPAGIHWEMVQEKVIAIVADKTGYPEDMLELDLDLEADLGIDTVKQVELFASAREDFDLPKDDTINLADYNTLRKIVDYVAGLTSGSKEEGSPATGEEGPEESVSEEKQTEEVECEEEETVTEVKEEAVHEASSGDQWEIVKEKVIAIVADKTGYPEDMLELDLDLEADLGIDTVKQVELFASAREDFSLPKDDTINLADYNTLRKIVDYVAGLVSGMGDGGSSVDSEEGASDEERGKEPVVEEGSEEEPEKEPEQDQAVDEGGHWEMVKGKVIEIVAEKTGYPEDMLELDLDLEADLGIDTVKQVELFAMAREDFSLPKDDSINLSEFPTLRHIVDYVAGLTGSGPGAAEESVSDEEREHQVEDTEEETRETEEEPEPEKEQEVIEPEEAPSADKSSPGPATSDHWEMVKGKVIEIVAEKTGYPEDMLELDLDLEADLGIDTVKQVELFAMARENFSLPKDDSINLSDFPSLRHIVDYVAGLTQDDQKAPAHPEPSGELSVEELKERASRWVLEARKLQDLDIEGEGVLEGSKVLVIGGGQKGAKAVQDILGAEVVMSTPTDILDDKIEYDGVTGIMNLFPFELEDTPTPENWNELGDLTTRSLFKATKALDTIFKDGGHFASIVRMGGRFGLDHDPNPFNGAIGGFTKAAVREYGKLRGLVLDVPVDMEVDEALVQLAKELRSDHGLPEIGWTGKKRFRPVLRIIQPPEPEKVDIRDGMNILIPGGGAGITAKIVIGLAGKAKLKMHITGRTPLPEDIEKLASLDDEGLNAEKDRIRDEMIATGEKFSPVVLDRKYGRVLKAITTHDLLSRVRELGSDIEYHAVSVTDAEGMKRIADEHGPFDGVIHAAGVEQSKLVGGKKMEDFDTVFDTKVLGAKAILDATKDHPLEFFISFSSVAGRFGNAGQVDYSAANEFLDKMHGTVRSFHPDCHVKAVGWSAWAEVGMAAKGSVKTLLEMGGVTFIPVDEGVGFAISEIESGDELEIFYAGSMGPLDTEGSMLWDEGINRREREAPNEEFEAPSEAADPIDEKGPSVLIDSIIEQEEGRIKVGRKLDGKRERFLPDHAIMGKMVFPGVMGLEIFAETAKLMYPEMEVIGLGDMTYKKAVNVDGEQEVFIEGELLEEDDDTKTVSLRLYSVIRSKRSDSSVEADHYSGKVILGTRPKECATVSDHPIRPKNVMAQILKEEIYQHLFHGDLFQVLHGIEVLKDGELLGIYRNPPSELIEPGTGWKDSDLLTAPMQTECGFQAAGAYVLDRFKLMALPTKVGAIEFYDRITPSDKGFAWVRFEGREDNTFKFDVDFIDMNGNVRFSYRDYQLKSLMGMEEELKGDHSVPFEEMISPVEDIRLFRIDMDAVPEDIDQYKEHFQEEEWKEMIGEKMTPKRMKEHVMGRMVAMLGTSWYVATESSKVVPIKEIKIGKEKNGKPYAEVSGERVEISISHSHRWGLCSVGEKVHGVDIELSEHRDRSFVDEAFSAEEVSVMENIMKDNDIGEHTVQTLMFSAKEAYLKKTGIGFGVDLRSVKCTEVLKKPQKGGLSFEVLLSHDENEDRVQSSIPSAYVITICS